MKRQQIRLALEQLEDRNAAGKLFDLSSLSLLAQLSVTSKQDTPPPPLRNIDAGHVSPSRLLAFEIEDRLTAFNTQPAQSREAVNIASAKVDFGLSGLLDNLALDFTLPQGLSAPRYGNASAFSGQSAFAYTGFNANSSLSTVPSSTSSSAFTSSSNTASVLIPIKTGAEFDAIFSGINAMRRGGLPQPQPNPAGTEYGFIRIDCTTTPAAGGNPEGILGADNPAVKLNPGWLSNVNWSADWSFDGDGNNGWNPTSTLTTTADPSATYTPDKDVPVVNGGGIPGGDPDLRKFVVYVAAQNNTGNHNWDFKLTFDASRVRVYKDNNTKSVGPVASEETFTPTETYGVVPPIVKSMTFYLEGIASSTTFRDIALKAQYVGGDILMEPGKDADTVNLTVIGVTQTGKFGGSQVEAENKQQPDNPKRFSSNPPLSNDEVGQISWDLQRYLDWSNGTPPATYCQYFADAMEMQGAVKPPRDANPSVYYGRATNQDDPTIPPVQPNPDDPPPTPALVTFTHQRWIYYQGWVRKSTDTQWTLILPEGKTVPEWVDDFSGYTSAMANVVTATTSGSHLYFNDGPGYELRTQIQFSYSQMYRDFRNTVFINFYGGKFMVSDWSRWHSVMFLKPKDLQFLTRAPNVPAAPPAPAKVRQDFGPGWIPKPITRDEDFLNW